MERRRRNHVDGIASAATSPGTRQTKAAHAYSSVRRNISSADRRLLVAADESRDFPAAAFLAEAELIAAERAQRFGRHEAGLAGRRDHLQHWTLLIARGVVLHHPDEMQAELLDHRRVGLRTRMHLETGLGRIGPVAFLGAGRLGERLKLLRVEGRVGRRADGVLTVRKRHAGRIGGGRTEQLPPRSLLAVELDRLGEIFDAGLLLVGLVTLLAHPEEVRHDEAGERLAILLLGDRAELLAERLEARIGDGSGRTDRHRLVRLGRSGGWLLLLLLRRRGRSALRRRAALTAGGRQLSGPR